LNAETLTQVLRPVENVFNLPDYPELLVGLGHPDDAAVWRLDSRRALVVTTDFFTPVVDDAYDFGSIAAANSISDIYAMGGQPFLALNVAALNPAIPVEVNAEILRGGAEKAREAGVVIAGGHSIQDNEPKYGLIVLGFVNPKRMLSKAGARPGDSLVLTKPLGFGVTTTALKEDKANPDDLAEVVNWMKQLNSHASSLALEYGLSGGTDVTGFSLLGHATEMAKASGVSIRFFMEKIPFTSGAHKYADMWTFPGGAADNFQYFGPGVRFSPKISEDTQMLLFDPQTSGGLLLAVPGRKLAKFLSRAEEMGQPAWVVGQVEKGNGIDVD
jgi:selenide,water dikinase